MTAGMCLDLRDAPWPEVKSLIESSIPKNSGGGGGVLLLFVFGIELYEHLMLLRLK